MAHPLVERAQAFAWAAHGAIGQTRKYSGAPYIVHPMRVAEIVTKAGGTPEQIAAAWLHDTVEDTKMTLMDIYRFFGPKVHDLVYWLTDKSKPEDGNRAARKAIDREHITIAPGEAQTVKLADLLDNTSDILQHDPHFAKVYMREKQLLLPCLLKGHPRLWESAKASINLYFSEAA